METCRREIKGEREAFSTGTKPENRERPLAEAQADQEDGSLRKTVFIRNEKSFQGDHRVSVERGWSDKQGLCHVKGLDM